MSEIAYTMTTRLVKGGAERWEWVISRNGKPFSKSARTWISKKWAFKEGLSILGVYEQSGE